MMKLVSIGLLFFYSILGWAQTAQEQMDSVKLRLDSIQSFEATIALHVDISFITMPDKMAQATFQKGEDMVITSDDFVLIPKRGLDLSFSELFKYSFLAIDRGEITGHSNVVRSISILPSNSKADFSVANLHVDAQNNRIVWAEINTKKDGTYILNLTYPDKGAILPTSLNVSFEMDRIRIPLNFAGSDVSIDRKKMRETEQKTGTIVLNLEYTKIEKTQ
ncbi:MAG TPA: hypothetical protein EYN07_11085 [Flavobacteriaceae bacterium]|nr:hypothetical protein [Flavobacteriaceae bacterium]HIN99772.1 hypothetical protein [Flavobacteriaceae bacterium]|tara:strand:- start:22347 stop:23006 length:660 start_codon:yes stop_codon:yes gene_type:complete